jgi:hypothetical protein
MKVVTKNKETRIFPFLKPEAEGGSDTYIIVRERGMIRLDQRSKTFVLSAEAARTLAEALLHAVEVAERGRE